MRAEDVEAVDDVDEWNALVLLPLLHHLGVSDDDHKVVVRALVVDLGLSTVCARHLGGGCLLGRGWFVGI